MNVIYLHLFKFIHIGLQDFAESLSIKHGVRTWELLKMIGCIQHICLYATSKYMPAKYCSFMYLPFWNSPVTSHKFWALL